MNTGLHDIVFEARVKQFLYLNWDSWWKAQSNTIFLILLPI